ncbi:MAG: bifunctional DNA-formamidopyrimidine glycosylase/DNA-(apurinic or apyrimidinic site) lyase [Clostridia bacterium]|nr:bifunctional DNA-formamidopyrimidine glycosylase/DNA-(apurinic or apyrimidinic site) lyase [Clostridia bacterium]
MPELPEVETVKRVLEPQLSGRRISGVHIKRREVIANVEAEEFVSAVSGVRIDSMGRRGKFLLLHLEQGSTVVLHLRMTGSLLLTPPCHPGEKHTHVVFMLDDGSELRYTDPRRFGRFWLLREGETDDCTGMQRLGPEPFDAQVTAEYLAMKAAGRRRPVKDFLLDQSIVAGIGNIYSDEILHFTGIRPDRSVSSLTKDEWERLAAAIPDRMSWFIEKNSIESEEYLQTGGREYRNTPYLRVYDHAGEPCPRCAVRIEKTRIGGRSSCFCPTCQK